jgi:hypothetical protein
VDWGRGNVVRVSVSRGFKGQGGGGGGGGGSEKGNAAIIALGWKSKKEKIIFLKKIKYVIMMCCGLMNRVMGI